MYNAKFVDAGSRTSFYKLDDERGFKEFEDKYSAEYAWNTQKKLAEYNLAPLVLSEIGKIRMNEDNCYMDTGFSRWGYITEIAEMVACGGNDCGCGECEYIWKSMRTKRRNLMKKMESIGIDFGDAHIGNVGYVKRKGRKILVCIDTGEESVCDEEISSYSGGCSCSMCRGEYNYA